jgi:uncharacterized protein YjdB
VPPECDPNGFAHDGVERPTRGFRTTGAWKKTGSRAYESISKTNGKLQYGAGTIDASGNYTAPARVPTQQTVSITAISQADTTKYASASVTLVPVSISVVPTTVTLSAAQTQQFTATVTNPSSPAGSGTITPPACTPPPLELCQR